MVPAWRQLVLAAAAGLPLICWCPPHGPPLVSFFVTERDLWSCRPLTSQCSSCALCCSPRAHTCRSTGFLPGGSASVVTTHSTPTASIRPPTACHQFCDRQNLAPQPLLQPLGKPPFSPPPPPEAKPGAHPRPLWMPPQVCKNHPQGVLLSGCTEVTVIKNRIMDEQWGLVFNNGARCVARENLLERCNKAAIMLTDNADPEVANNTIEVCRGSAGGPPPSPGAAAGEVGAGKPHPPFARGVGLVSDLPLASAGSDMIRWSRVLLSHTLDAACSY